jgi:phosphatidate cytidylyltransferase
VPWKRLLTAAVLVPPLAAAILYGKGWPFLILVGFATLLCAREYARMFFTAAWDKWSIVILSCLIYVFGALVPLSLVFPAVLCGLMITASRFFAFRGTPAERGRATALAAVGVVYIGGFFSAYPRVMAIPGGEHWVLMGLLAVAAGDTGAYVVGRTFGRSRLAPSISPNKTLEGAFGGLAASVAVATAYGAVFLPSVPVWYAAASAAVVGAAGQGGDLFESMLKRAAGVKDSGRLLPGHGGLLDRADGVLWAGPALHLLAALSPLAGSAAL